MLSLLNVYHIFICKTERFFSAITTFIAKFIECFIFVYSKQFKSSQLSDVKQTCLKNQMINTFHFCDEYRDSQIERTDRVHTE